MYYLGELLDIPCTIVTPPLVKMLGILCINMCSILTKGSTCRNIPKP